MGVFRPAIKAIFDDKQNALWVLRTGFTILEQYCRSKDVYITTDEAMLLAEVSYRQSFVPAHAIVCSKCRAPLLESPVAFYVDGTPPELPAVPAERKGLKVVK